jgi:uncharacterized protein (TIGR02145 family)
MKRILKIDVLFVLLSLMLVSFKLKPNDDEFVDLGLSVKWATCNVGAKSPTEYGDYYTFDAALKSGMRLPTETEFKELIDNCTWFWAEENGVKGYKVTSKKNGHSIFLPAAGHSDGTGVYYVGSYGEYWSSSANDDYNASYLTFDSNDVYMDNYNRYYRQSVRLVR